MGPYKVLRRLGSWRRQGSEEAG